MTLIETPQRARLVSQQIARIHVVTARAEIQPAMQAALQELSAALQQQGLSPVAPWFAHHYRRPNDTFDFDVCFPVAQPILPTGRVEPAQTESCDVIRTAHAGSYEDLHAAWREFGDWIDEHQQPVLGDLFEVYVTGPRENPDPAQWRTEMNYPLAEQGNQGQDITATRAANETTR